MVGQGADRELQLTQGLQHIVQDESRVEVCLLHVQHLALEVLDRVERGPAGDVELADADVRVAHDEQYVLDLVLATEDAVPVVLEPLHRGAVQILPAGALDVEVQLADDTAEGVDRRAVVGEAGRAARHDRHF